MRLVHKSVLIWPLNRPNHKMSGRYGDNKAKVSSAQDEVQVFRATCVLCSHESWLTSRMRRQPRVFCEFCMGICDLERTVRKLQTFKINKSSLILPRTNISKSSFSLIYRTNSAIERDRRTPRKRNNLFL